MILDNNIELPLHSVQRERREVHPLYTQESELLVFPKHKRVQSLFSNEMSQSECSNTGECHTALDKYGARRVNGKEKTVRSESFGEVRCQTDQWKKTVPRQT